MSVLCTIRKPVSDFLLLINTNWHLISYRFEVIAHYCLHSGHFAFLIPLWKGEGFRGNVHCLYILCSYIHASIPIHQYFLLLLLKKHLTNVNVMLKYVLIYRDLNIYYHPRMPRGNIFSRIYQCFCLVSSCLFVCRLSVYNALELLTALT